MDSQPHSKFYLKLVQVKNSVVRLSSTLLRECKSMKMTSVNWKKIFYTMMYNRSLICTPILYDTQIQASTLPIHYVIMYLTYHDMQNFE